MVGTIWGRTRAGVKAAIGKPAETDRDDRHMAFLKGAVWGVVVGGAGAVAASLLAPQPAGPVPPEAPLMAGPAAPAAPAPEEPATPPAPAADAAPATVDSMPAAPAAPDAVAMPEVAAEAAPAATLQDAAPVVPPAPEAERSADVSEGSAEPAPVQAPAAAMPDPATGGGPAAPDTAPALRPSPDPAPSEPTAPGDLSLAQEAPAPDVPVLPSLQSRAPQVPAAEADIVVQTAPPPPVPSVAEDGETAVIVEDEPSDTATADDGSDAVARNNDGGRAAGGSATTQSAADSGADQTEASGGSLRTLPKGAPGPAPADGEAEAADGVAVPAVPAQTAAEVAAATATPVTVLDETPTEAPTIADTMGDPERLPAAMNEGATVSVTTPETRLTVRPPASAAPAGTVGAPSSPMAPAPAGTPARPSVVSIIDAPASGLPGAGRTEIIRRDAPASAPAADRVMPVVDDDAPALVRYGAFFDNPAGLPLLTLVLIDDGTMTDGPRALADVPFPVTVLLDPRRPGASERMDAYAAAGIEIAALAALPEGATDADVKVAMEGTFDALPRAVALVETGQGDLAVGPEVAGPLIGDLAQAGRGLLVPDQGLNGALRAAAAADVPALTIYRDLDATGQDARVIRRFIDQAAFRARQQRGVVLLARLRPETVSALILWGDANRAGQVALAPLSTTLLAQ